MEKQHNELLKVRDETKNDYEEFKKDKEKTDKKFNKLEKANARIKAFQILRIRDYQKELSFWRNLIKRLIIEYFNKSPKDSEKFIEMVTEEMKTFNTREKNIEDSDVASFYIKWLNDS